MSRFLNINTMSLLGTAIEGVRSVQVEVPGTTMEYSGDDDAGAQDIGVTKRHATIRVEVLDSSKRRDIKDPQFTDKAGVPVTTDLNEVLQASLSLRGEAKQDSAEDDTWLTYIGVAKIAGELELLLRDVDQSLGSVFPVGVRGKVDFDLQAPKSTEGLPDPSALTNVEMDNLVLQGVQTSHPHNELAQATLRFGAHGASGAAPAITSAAIPKNPGDTGTTSFVAVSATGGTDKTITISNSVLVGLSARIEHGGIFMVTYELQAYSSDGDTSPIAVT